MLRKVSALISLMVCLCACSTSKPLVLSTIHNDIADLSGYGINNSSIQTIDVDDIKSIMDNQESAIIIFAMPFCPWCQSALPMFAETLAAYQQNDAIYYYDCSAFSQSDYQKLEEVSNLVADVLPKKDDGSVNFIVPDVILIENGKASNHHVSTVSSHKDPTIELTQAQRQELASIYSKMIDTLYR